MKIRKATDTSDMRGKTTKDRVCEECKEIKQEGHYLTLGFFFGFLCNACLNRLAFLIRQEGIWYEPERLEDQPDFIKEIIRTTKCCCDFSEYPHTHGGGENTPQSTQEAQGARLGPGVTPEYFSGINDAIMVLEQRLAYLKGLQ